MKLVFACLSYYLLADLGVNVAYHRCLSHRSFRLKKWLERTFVSFGLAAGTPIQWVGNHRYHHQHSDEPGDPHSPNQRGFWHAHVGWYLSTENPWICLPYCFAGPLRTLFDGWLRPHTNQEHNALAKDIAADPYYRFLSRPIPYMVACTLYVLIFFGVSYLFAGFTGIITAWVFSVFIYNLGDSVNSFGHLYGPKPFDTTYARNNAIIAHLALGEGWHANHHAFPSSARHGLLPHQWDATYRIIQLLEKLGLASSIRLPSADVLKQGRQG